MAACHIRGAARPAFLSAHLLAALLPSSLLAQLQRSRRTTGRSPSRSTRAARPARRGRARRTTPPSESTCRTRISPMAPAVVICPGGGYRGLAIDHEGQQIAPLFQSGSAWRRSCCATASAPDYQHPAPLNDAQRAMQFVRANAAKEFGVDKTRVGVMGFSAGGHLASSLATHWHRGRPDSADAVERESCRPDFAILGYPVVTFTEKQAHARRLQEELCSARGSGPQARGSSCRMKNRSTPKRRSVLSPSHGPATPGCRPRTTCLFYLALREGKDAGRIAHLPERRARPRPGRRRSRAFLLGRPPRGLAADQRLPHRPGTPGRFHRRSHGRWRSHHAGLDHLDSRRHDPHCARQVAGYLRNSKNSA